MKLPDGFMVRAPTAEDAQAVTDLIRSVDMADYGEPDYGIEDVRADWRREPFDIEQDTWLVLAADGSLAGYGNAYGGGDRWRYDPTTSVHPAFRELGIEEYHLARAEARARASVTQVIEWIVNVEHDKPIARLKERGYDAVRHDYVMEIVMEAPPPAPVVPAAIALRPFRRGEDERAVWAAVQEAFEDMWGHTPSSFEAWESGFMGHADWSPELTTVAQAGDDIAGAAIAYHFDTGGWIRSLGVRRPWRKQGLGLALLYDVFGKMYARGEHRVGLGVDAESLTGATRLYERAGMRVKHHYARYRKTVQ